MFDIVHHKTPVLELLAWSATLINKAAGLAFNFIKKRLHHWCFPVKFAKFLRTPFFEEHIRWLLQRLASITSTESQTCPHLEISDRRTLKKS